MQTFLYFIKDVLLRISSGFRFQLLRVPLIKPETTTNIRTRTLMQVNTLLTIADSFTPNANRPVKHIQGPNIRCQVQTLDIIIIMIYDSLAYLLE